jgi:hypothetical protein
MAAVFRRGEQAAFEELLLGVGEIYAAWQMCKRHSLYASSWWSKKQLNQEDEGRHGSSGIGASGSSDLYGSQRDVSRHALVSCSGKHVGAGQQSVAASIHRRAKRSTSWKDEDSQEGRSRIPNLGSSLEGLPSGSAF